MAVAWQTIHHTQFRSNGLVIDIDQDYSYTISIVIKLLRVARLQFLLVGLTLFAFGALWGILLGANFLPIRLLFGYMVIMSAQLSVHFGNDYFDISSDRSDRGTLISGGGGVLLDNPELRKPAKWIAVILVFVSLGMGTAFIWIYSYPFWMIGFVLLGNLLGWFYSAPPINLSQRGLGELCYTIISGFLIPGMGYLAMRGVLDLKGNYFAIPLMLYGLASILSVEIPDMEDDRLSGKRTWVAQKGRKFGFALIGWLLVAATIYFFIYPILDNHQVPVDIRIIGLVSLLPLGVGVFGLLKKPTDREPATRVASWIVVLLAVFSVIVDVYLFYLTGNLKM